MSNLQLQKDYENVIAQVRVLFPHLSKVKDEEIAKAIALAKTLELNPLKKEVHFIPFGTSVQLITSYTEYIKRAEKTGRLNGWKVNYGKDDLGEYAEVIIYRKDWQYPFEWRVYLKEAQQNSPLWKKMPIFMLRKTAIAQAFRLAFPEETAELPYEEAELPQQQTEQIIKAEEETEAEIVIEDNNQEDLATERQIKAIKAISQKKGIDDKKIIKEKFGVDSTKQLTKQQASQIIEELQELNEKQEDNEIPF